MRQVLAKTENIKQFVEDRSCKPRDAIHEIEQRLNDLSLALRQQHSPIEKCTRQIYGNLVHGTKENIPRKHPVTRHTHSKWTGSLAT